MNKEQVIEMFKEGLDCGQVITLAIAEDIGLDKELALKSTAPFGGGVFEADICGSYVGGLIALGFKYGHSKPGDMETKGQMISKIFQYKEKFNQLHQSHTCAGILGYNLTIPEESKIIEEKNLMFTVCPQLVLDVIDIVKNL